MPGKSTGRQGLYSKASTANLVPIQLLTWQQCHGAVRQGDGPTCGSVGHVHNLSLLSIIMCAHMELILEAEKVL